MLRLRILTDTSLWHIVSDDNASGRERRGLTFPA